MDLLAALGFAFLGSIGAVVAAGAVIYLGNRSSRFMLSLVSFATGTLLGAALLGSCWLRISPTPPPTSMSFRSSESRRKPRTATAVRAG